MCTTAPRCLRRSCNSFWERPVFVMLTDTKKAVPTEIHPECRLLRFLQCDSRGNDCPGRIYGLTLFSVGLFYVRLSLSFGRRYLTYPRLKCSVVKFTRPDSEATPVPFLIERSRHIVKNQFVGAYARTGAEGHRKTSVVFVEPHGPHIDSPMKRPSTGVEALPPITCPEKLHKSTSIRLA